MIGQNAARTMLARLFVSASPPFSGCFVRARSPIFQHMVKVVPTFGFANSFSRSNASTTAVKGSGAIEVGVRGVKVLMKALQHKSCLHVERLEGFPRGDMVVYCKQIGPKRSLALQCKACSSTYTTTTTVTSAKGEQKTYTRELYGFNGTKGYGDVPDKGFTAMPVVFTCLSDKASWLFDGRKLDAKKSDVVHITVGKNGKPTHWDEGRASLDPTSNENPYIGDVVCNLLHGNRYVKKDKEEWKKEVGCQHEIENRTSERIKPLLDLAGVTETCLENDGTSVERIWSITTEDGTCVSVRVQMKTATWLGGLYSAHAALYKRNGKWTEKKRDYPSVTGTTMTGKVKRPRRKHVEASTAEGVPGRPGRKQGSGLSQANMEEGGGTKPRVSAKRNTQPYSFECFDILCVVAPEIPHTHARFQPGPVSCAQYLHVIDRHDLVEKFHRLQVTNAQGSVVDRGRQGFDLLYPNVADLAANQKLGFAARTKRLEELQPHLLSVDSAQIMKAAQQLRAMLVSYSVREEKNS
eukprot:GDKI01041962.1.p1 GENE.GDKI01041962.1~~GDKI01041962.1.p1  ORF type:complete len:523 (-),score=32.91 GDKI01041962.1:64-1632(-)